MKDKLQGRLQALQSEFEAGQTMLSDLEAKQMQLRETLLRISGAIQVLEEVLSETSEDNGSTSDIPDRSSETTLHQQTDVLT